MDEIDQDRLLGADFKKEQRNFKLQLDILDTLLAIKASTQKSRLFLPIEKQDGSVLYVNLSQATQIHRASEDECQINLSDGQVIAVSTKEGVDAVIQAIQEEIVIIEDLSTAPQPQVQTK